MDTTVLIFGKKLIKVFKEVVTSQVEPNANDIHAISCFNIKKKSKFYLDAKDVLNLHCIHEGFFNYLALP